MAISFVANALGGTTTTTSFSITLPTTQASDIIILEFTHRGTGDGTATGTYSGPAPTLKHSQLFASSAFSGKTFWTRATGNHSGQTIGRSGLTNSCAGIVTIYRGALTSADPLADATVVGEENASGDETQAQITTSTDGAWVVLVVSNSPDLAVSSQSCTSPGALTERAERLSTGGTDSSISHASAEKASAGATGSFTWAQTNAASGSWAYAITPEPELNHYTLDSVTGAFTFSGNSALLERDARVVASSGAFTLNGQVAILSRGRRMSGEVGSYSLTGSVAGLIDTRKLGASHGQFSYTGIGADLDHARKLFSDSGVFSLTGNSASLEYSGGVTPGVAARLRMTMGAGL